MWNSEIDTEIAKINQRVHEKTHEVILEMFNTKHE